MSVAFAYRFQQQAPTSSLQDLDRVALTAAVVADDGRTVDVGAEGTVVGTSEAGDLYTVEFAEPPGTLVTAEAYELRLVERAKA